MSIYVIFFFKQKTAYEMRISDWSSDVCSSDLELAEGLLQGRLVLGVGQHEERRRVVLQRLPQPLEVGQALVGIVDRNGRHPAGGIVFRRQQVARGRACRLEGFLVAELQVVAALGTRLVAVPRDGHQPPPPPPRPPRA